MAAPISSLERLFHALGDATRLRIVGLLLAGEVCVCTIHETLGLSQPKVSRHLAYLRRAGVVATRREGAWVHYRLATPASAPIATVLQTVVHALGHVDEVARDARRLERHTGCRIRPPAARLTYICCAPKRPSAPG